MRLLGILLAAALLLLGESNHAAADSHGHAPTELQRKPIASHIGVNISSTHVITKRSKLLQQQPLSTGGIKHVQTQEGELERSSEGLNIHFFYRLDPTRSDEEVDYIKNKLMPSTATVLARSIRVCTAPCSCVHVNMRCKR